MSATKTIRTVEEIQADIEKSDKQFDSCRDYFGAMWNCDVQASMFRTSWYSSMDRLRAELKEAQAMKKLIEVRVGDEASRSIYAGQAILYKHEGDVHPQIAHVSDSMATLIMSAWKQQQEKN